MMTDALSMAAVAFSRQSLVCRREVTVVPVAGKEIVLPYDKDDEECVHIIRISDDNHELLSVGMWISAPDAPCDLPVLPVR